jgi:hypothetical protein
VPLFECSRCNALTYSSASLARPCPTCGAERWRVLAETSFAAAEVSARRLEHGDHCAVTFGEDVAHAAAICSAVIAEATRRGDPVLCHMPDRLRAAVECPAEGVTWLEAADMYPDPFEPDTVVACHERAIQTAGGPVWFLSGPTRPIAEIVDAEEWRRYERLVHEVLHRTEAVAVCLLDTTLNDESVLGVVRETHPLITDGEHVRRNPAFAYAA